MTKPAAEDTLLSEIDINKTGTQYKLLNLSLCALIFVKGMT